MKRRSIFKAIASLFAATKVAPPVLKPRIIGTSIMTMPRDSYEAVFGRENGNPLFKGGPPRWEKMQCPIATADGKITDYYYQPSEDGESITLLGKV